jgi:hypothetical protein
MLSQVGVQHRVVMGLEHHTNTAEASWHDVQVSVLLKSLISLLQCWYHSNTELAAVPPVYSHDSNEAAVQQSLTQPNPLWLVFV